MYTCYIQSLRILAGFCSWTGWFESYLVKNLCRHIFAWCRSFNNSFHIKWSVQTLCHLFLNKSMQNNWAASWQNQQSVCPAKTQISLGIRPVRSESSLSAWRKLGSLATHWALSEDSDQTGRMPSLIRVFAGRTATLLVLTRSGSDTLCNI